MSKDQVKAFKAPSPIIILVCVITLCALASYVIPAGVYDRVKDVHTGKMVVDPATFHYVAQKPTGFLDLSTRALRAVSALSPFCSWSAVP